MRPQFTRLRGIVLGALLALACGSPAMADDTEIFTGAVRPNILFIIDTSGSMDGRVQADAENRTRLQVVQDVARNFVNSASGINLGLMRYDAGADGGMVTVAVAPVEDQRPALISSIDSFEADGSTPLSETLYEALQYYAGREVFFGLDSRDRDGPLPSVATSRSSDNSALYRSPMELGCQRNFIVYLTDGLPNSDGSADQRIKDVQIGTQSFGSLVSNDCDVETFPGDADTDGSGRCLDDLAEFLFEADLRPDDLEGDQNVVTYTIGFGPDVAGSPFLEEVAQRGGGQAFAASDADSLTEALGIIAGDIDIRGASFAAPSVAVNAFNRTETLSDVYLSLFQPTNRFHWPGNVKKYQIQDGQLVDADGDPAIDANGLLSIGSRSFWSATADGESVVAGGAANRLPDAAQRRLFTFLGAADLTLPANAVTTANTVLTPELLGLGLPGQPTVSQLINWTRGFDEKDEDADGDLAEARRRAMGDPLHGQSAVVIYGGSAESPEAVVYTPTNDGFLHAFDANSGAELWAFIPPELLGRLVGLYEDNLGTSKNYGLDGDIRAVRIDRNQNGIIESADGDRVLLYFGMRRGGNNYYALDVTNKTGPRHLWTLGPTELPGIGQTWSTPAFTRIRAEDTSAGNPDAFALVFGGGYDETQDNDQGSTLYSTDALGNRIFIVDALSGARLWFAGGTGIGTPNLLLNGSGGRMNNSIPAPLRVIDLDGDGFADRMYAADTGARVWRFDIITDADPATAGQQVPDADELVTGGVIASLGNADDTAHPIASTRRFYEAPDVALVQRRGAAPYFSIALGSGWRGHPLNTQIQDRFYSLRDYQPFLKFTQADYNTRPVIVDRDLADITEQVNPTVPIGSPGWKLELRLPGDFAGEKVLAESRTFNNVVFFPTYLPAGAAANPCEPSGNNRAYAVSVDDGRPVIDINRDERITLEDRYSRLAQGGIAPEFTFLFPGQVEDGTGGDDDDEEQNPRRPVLCSSGGEFLPDLCVDAGTPVRTYWRQGRAQ